MSKIRWAIAVESKTESWELELPTAICSCFNQLGYQASLVRDGDPKGLESDGLLFLDCSVHGNYPMYRKMLKHCGPKRPVTILWLMDPLPPDYLSCEEEAIGLNASRWRDRLGLSRTAEMSHWKKLYTFYRLRVSIYKQLSSYSFRKISRLIKHKHHGDLDWHHIRAVMENWQNVLDSYNESWVDHFVASTNQRKLFLMNRGINAHFIPFGAHEYMGRDLGLRRDILVGFLGYVKYGRRVAMLERLDKSLNDKGIPLTRLVNSGYFGEQRCEWLNRTRILVNLHNFSWNPAWIRFLMAASCGTLIVSEPMNDKHPMVDGVHYITATLDEMPETISRLLNDREKMDQITNASSLICQQELSLLSSVEKLSRLG